MSRRIDRRVCGPVSGERRPARDLRKPCAKQLPTARQTRPMQLETVRTFWLKWPQVDTLGDRRSLEVVLACGCCNLSRRIPAHGRLRQVQWSGKCPGTKQWSQSSRRHAIPPLSSRRRPLLSCAVGSCRVTAGVRAALVVDLDVGGVLAGLDARPHRLTIGLRTC